ncbi:MAG TPA: asparagine synthase (glutamine-hydrolyzing) [Candidatus Limnocylindrales bacterium]|nr:asparagine synthase (glutamine-hydrolyzing) [Candidatus Limnocylindrales bacterium]
MCGICGVIGVESKEANERIVRRMLSAIVHRGPDGQGALISPPVGLGSRRLSIIDVQGGSQPIWNEAGDVAVVFNGEIYNFRSLRTELESLGHRFTTGSDTEVIVHAYETWGASCTQHLKGMFAFAVVELSEGRDSRPAKVLLARDRLGIKPLYYAALNGVLYFASEVRALIASGAVPVQVSAAAVPSYLLFGSVVEPCTFVENVFSLPPGHTLSISIGKPFDGVSPQPYWKPAMSNKSTESEPARHSVVESRRHVRELLEDAVEAHLVSDVPIGIFLSSGIDSTVLAALASRAQNGIHTFTVAFPESEFSEAAIARETAKSLGTNHSELALSEQDLISRLQEAIGAFDQPSMDGVNTYFVSWAARQAGLKVALSGLGSDELFGGYRSFRATRQIARLTAMAHLVSGPFRSFVAGPLSRVISIRNSRDATGKAIAAWLNPGSLPHPYFFTRTLFTSRTVVSALSAAPIHWQSTPWATSLSAAAEDARLTDGFTAVSWLELRCYLLNTLLRDTDAMSMSQSLEVRVPFLDSDLVDYVLSLSEEAKANRAQPKALLVESLGDLLPKQVTAQPKRTFTFPWELWLRGDLGKQVGSSLEDWSPVLAAHVRPEFPRAVWSDFLSGRTTWSRPWSLYVLNEWVRRNVAVDPAGKEDRPAPATVTAA